VRTFVVPVCLAIHVMTGAAACPRVSAEEPAVDYTHTLLLRRPLLEQEVETQVGYRSGSRGREADATIALDVRLLPRWQIELAAPVLYLDPSRASSEAGIGDLVLENKVLFYFSPERKLMLSGGVDVVLPTGSPDRGLGGAVGFAPFAVVGFKVGGFDVLADIAYRVLFRPKLIGGDPQQLTTGIAIAHPLTRRLAPFVELTTVTNVNAHQGVDERLVGRPQVYVGPGLNIRIRPGVDFVLGIQAPLSDARTFNVGGRAGLVLDF
jgi:Putative MetA-pathway of phenol degradation